MPTMPPAMPPSIPPSATPKTPPSSLTYHEKLTIPLWYPLIAAGVIAIISYEVYIACNHHRASLWVVPVLVFISVLVCFSLSRTVISIDMQRNLLIGEKQVNLAAVDRAMIVDKAMKQAAMGRQLDPLAWAMHKGWIKDMVIIVFDIPQAGHPYWIFSTRRPQEIIASLPERTKIIE